MANEREAEQLKSMFVKTRVHLSFPLQQKMYSPGQPCVLSKRCVYVCEFCLTSCILWQVKVVILGQDPYHGPKQAHGQTAFGGGGGGGGREMVWWANDVMNWLECGTCQSSKLVGNFGVTFLQCIKIKTHTTDKHLICPYLVYSMYQVLYQGYYLPTLSQVLYQGYYLPTLSQVLYQGYYLTVHLEAVAI